MAGSPSVALGISRELRTKLVVPVLGAVFVATVVACATIGSVPIATSTVLGLPLRALGIVRSDAAALALSEQQDAVLVAIRLPRLALGALVGAALALSGASMQGLFRNALADPALLGISSGSALGAVATIVLGSSITHLLPPSVVPFLLPITAFGGAIAAMAAIQRVGRFDGRTSVAMLLLGGIAINALCQALMGLLVYTANDAQLRNITFWNLGSLGGTTWTTVASVAPFLLLPAIALPRFARSLDAILLGEAEAGHLGIAVERTKRIVFALVALAVGASVAAAGILGFVGLVVPHLLRLAVGPSHKTLLPASALLGASLMLVADAVARTIVTPAELPLGIVTAGIGTPFFLALLVRERRSIA